MNEKLISSFKDLAMQEKQSEAPNIHKIRAHLKVAKILSEIQFKITSSDQVKDIAGIGEKTILKIDEILQSGKLTKLEGFIIPNNYLNDQKKLGQLNQ